MSYGRRKIYTDAAEITAENVVDEVRKEKLKEMSVGVDVLTLTATPIPRTLNMAMGGIVDMSVLEEAPGLRSPVQTYVMEYNDEMVREAIQRELSRQGQVYYVYNKVQDIDEIAARIQKLVPEANVAYAHGQMKEHKLESIMLDFINGEIDVLVSTTIIETGLDISNANTMIIHDADQLGLSQMYQLRGRVGRSNRMAYAFLMYRRDKLLREVAEKRLAAIRVCAGGSKCSVYCTTEGGRGQDAPLKKEETYVRIGQTARAAQSLSTFR